MYYIINVEFDFDFDQSNDLSCQEGMQKLLLIRCKQGHVP